jgi:opacity protein-like surface antigen
MFKKTVILSFLTAAALAAPAAAQNWTAEIYGGGVFSRNEDYGGVSTPLDAGTAFGVGIYERNLVPGVELGLDLMGTQADYTGTDTGVESLSLMLNARWPFPISAGTTGYVGAGLGAIRVTYDGGTTNPAGNGDDTVAGGQIGLGVRYNLAAFTAFAELKHQFAFDDALIQGVTQSYASTSALVGVRFAF